MPKGAGKFKCPQCGVEISKLLQHKSHDCGWVWQPPEYLTVLHKEMEVILEAAHEDKEGVGGLKFGVEKLYLAKYGKPGKAPVTIDAVKNFAATADQTSKAELLKMLLSGLSASEKKSLLK